MNTFLRYFVIGVLTVLIDFIILYILSSCGLDKVISNYISVLVSVPFNFFMQNYWSFRAGSSNKLQKSIKYIMLTIFNCFVNTYGFYVLFKVILIENYIYTNVTFLPKILPDGFLAKIFIIGMIMSWNFFLFKYWVFKPNEKKNEL